MAKLSILGLYNQDSSIFDDMAVPDSELFDKDTLIDSILMNLAELELLYPDYDFMKYAISKWSNARLNTWQHMADVLFEDYDPFVNIKRDEQRTITETRNLKNEIQNRVNAYNDVTTPVDRSSGEQKDTGTITTNEHYHLEGDSAITDAQDVMLKEIEVRKAYNIYDIITEEFKQRFCLMVY